MKGNSVLKLGGMCAILLGIAKVLSGAGYLLLSPEQRVLSTGANFLPSFAQDSSLLMAVFWVEAAVGILGLAVVPAMSSVVHSMNEGWVRWVSTLATVGYAVSSVGYLLSIARIPVIAAAYVKGDPATQAALAVVWRSSPDLLGLWGYGAVGVWVLVISLLAMRGSTFPKLHAYLGLALAVLYFLTPAGVIFKAQPLLLISAGAGALAAPIWYVWSGLVLRRTSA